MTPVSQIGCRPGRAPGPHLPGELERAISGSCSAWPVLPTVTLTHTRSRPLGTAGWEEERLSFTLTQLLREGFLSLVQALRPALGSGGGASGVGGGLIQPWAFLLPWNSSIGIT